MSNYRDETDPAEGFNLSQQSWREPRHPRFGQLEGYPELVPVLTEAVNEVITGASDRHQSALETCYEVAAATVQAVVTQSTRRCLVQPRSPPAILTEGCSPA